MVVMVGMAVGMDVVVVVSMLARVGPSVGGHVQEHPQPATEKASAVQADQAQGQEPSQAGRVFCWPKYRIQVGSPMSFLSIAAQKGRRANRWFWGVYRMFGCKIR